MPEFSLKPGEIEAYFDRLWPIFRSITGNGVRRTHKILSELIPLHTTEVPTGTKVLDWTIPKEWVVNEAYLVDPNGNHILDIKENNLHLLNYSIPFIGEVTLQELNKHLYSIEKMPNAIPYVTSYYEPRWGFCLTHKQRNQLSNGLYRVHIDTELIDGSMTISDIVLPGETDQEIFFSTYTCHPSLANNELSGPLVTAYIYKYLSELKNRKFTYRFLFAPETIGAITYLSKKGQFLKKNTLAGFVVTCVGDDGKFYYKKSRNGNTILDKAMECILNNDEQIDCKIIDFFPWGSDERQYCSPGFDLPIGSLTRTMYGKYPEYHTSLDDKEFISFPAMIETIKLYAKVCSFLEKNEKNINDNMHMQKKTGKSSKKNCIYINKKPWGEPQLGKYGLYPTLSNMNDAVDVEKINAIRWILSYSDGKHGLLDIANLSKIPFKTILNAAKKCEEKKLIEVYRN